MITAVIAEKPSVAKDIANVLNVRERHDGYLSGNGYLVTWAFGHLVQLAMPEAYGYTGFRRENLPILPQEFKYIPRQIREGKEYKPGPRRAQTVEGHQGGFRPFRPYRRGDRCRA